MARVNAALPAFGGLISTGWLAQATETVADNGATLQGVAAIIAALTGMVTALGALFIATRSKAAVSPADTAKDELLLELLQEKLAREREDEAP